MSGYCGSTPVLDFISWHSAKTCSMDSKVVCLSRAVRRKSRMTPTSISTWFDCFINTQLLRFICSRASEISSSYVTGSASKVFCALLINSFLLSSLPVLLSKPLLEIYYLSVSDLKDAPSRSTSTSRISSRPSPILT